ncbi:glycosyltransferase family 39 protein [Acidithiobacillus sp.]|uniref:ArnT family glycosyltransferase n=1 Tax=Acidithiobacillus sp. TaxID=1872118 RepID=UPI0025C285E6|nr:glycosyltransferase family 39 protein [Acidithiobacillus sp.]
MMQKTTTGLEKNAWQARDRVLPKILAESPLLWLGLALLVGVHYALILWGPFGISGDEAQYWLWSRHLAWGYYTKSPLIAGILALSTLLAGNSLLAVRLFAPIFALALAGVAYLFAREVHGEPAPARLAALWMACIPVYFLGGLVMTTDVPMLLLWLLALWAFWRAIVCEQRWAWLLAGTAVGLGLQAKYNLGVLPAAVLVTLLGHGSGRRQLRTPWPWLGVVVALLILAPNLRWNSQHGWATVLATWGNVTGGQGGWSSWWSFLGGQIGVLGVLPFFLLAVLLWRERRSWPAGRSAVLVWISLITWVFYALKSLSGQVDANWPIAAYLGLIIWAAGPLSRAPWRQWALASLAVCTLLIATVLALPQLHALGVPLPSKWYVPFKQTRGWRELAAAAQDRLERAQPAFVVTNFYQYSATLAFYLPTHPFVYYQSFSSEPSKCSIHGNQYLLWPGYEGRLGENALLVLDGENAAIPSSWIRQFRRCGRPENFSATSAGVTWHRVTLLLCRDFLGPQSRSGPGSGGRFH